MRRAAAVLLTTLLVFSASENVLSEGPSQSSIQDGLRLLHNMQEALGGVKRIAAVRDFEESIRAEAWDARGSSLGEVRKRTRWMRSPHVIRLDQKGPRGTYVLYYDGASDTGWEILPDLKSADAYQTTRTPISLAGGELEFARSYLSGFDLTMWLADQDRGYVVSSPRPNVVRIEHGGKATDFALDPANWLPLRSTGVSLADPDRPVPAEMHFEEWKDFSGVRFPTRRVSYHSGVKRGEVTTESIRVNGDLKAGELAAKPADSMPDLPHR